MISDVDDNNNDGTSNFNVTNFEDSVLFFRDSNFNSKHQDNLDSKLSKTSGHNLTFFVSESKETKRDVNQIAIIDKSFSIPKSSSEKDIFEELIVNKDLNTDKPQYDRSNSAPIKIVGKTKNLRGILKYPPGWRRRAVSESSALIYSSDDNGYFGNSLDSPDTLFDFDDYEDDDDICIDGDKPRKSVSFSSKMAVFEFRPNSSILGRRLKNQKKAKKKKEKKLRETLSSIENSDENLFSEKKLDDLEATKNFIEMQRFQFDDCYDSTSELSSSSGCESSGDEGISGEIQSDGSENKMDDLTKFSSKSSKRKNRRNRNRRNKQNIRTKLETGGYESE